jgi:rhodanese-related sulfurtransferase
MSTVITREELVRVISEGTVTVLEAMPAAHYAAEHLPGAINVLGELTPADAARVAPDRGRTAGLPLESTAT